MSKSVNEEPIRHTLHLRTFSWGEAGFEMFGHVVLSARRLCTDAKRYTEEEVRQSLVNDMCRMLRCSPDELHVVDANDPKLGH